MDANGKGKRRGEEEEARPAVEGVEPEAAEEEEELIAAGPSVWRKVHVRIEGVSPLLMHKFPMVPIEALEKKDPAEQAEYAAYRDGDNQLFIPGQAVQRGLIGGAAYSKGKGRGSLARIAAACLLVTPDQLLLGTTKYEVDARPVVVPATKGRVLRYRPRLDKWACEFNLEWDERLLNETQARRIVDDLGARVGLLDFRPEKRGPFGRFMVTHWERVA